MQPQQTAPGTQLPDQAPISTPANLQQARTARDIREALQAGILGQEAAAHQATAAPDQASAAQQQAPPAAAAAPEQASGTAHAPAAALEARCLGMPCGAWEVLSVLGQ